MELTVHVVQQYHSQKGHICCIKCCPHINFIVTAVTCTCLVSVFITNYYGINNLCTSTISFSEELMLYDQLS